MRICHDNNGKGEKASWFLKFIIVHDLQTRDKYYFICNKWFALDKDDCQINRLLPVALNEQKTEFNYLLEKETKDKLNDGHLWLSIFTRPLYSSFTRTDRLTCCFVILYMSMLMNIMYYGMSSSDNDDSSTDGLKIGPLSITPQQISIGIITNLVVMPPSMLLVFLFRKTRKRLTKSFKLRSAIKRIKGFKYQEYR